VDHFEYRPIGDIVNTTSRLEGLNKILGTRILITQQVTRHLPLRMTRCMGRFLFKGKSHPTIVYELLDPYDDMNLKRRFWFHRGLRSFQQGRLRLAERQFQHLLSEVGADGPTAYYLWKIKNLSRIRCGDKPFFEMP